MKKALHIIIIILVLAGIVALFNQRSLTTVSDPVRVRLGWVHQAQFAGMYVAEQRGLYKEEGIDIDLLPANFEVDQLIEIGNGEVDFSIMEAHQLLAAASLAGELQAIAAIYQINPHALAARRDSGIDGPEDFTGKVIGLSGGKTEGDALFEIFVNEFSDAESITFKELGFDTVSDFINQEADIIDVYRVDQPFLAEQKGIPLNIIPLDAYGFSTYGDVIVAKKDLIRENPDLVRRFLKATMDGWEYALRNPEEAVDITLQYAEGEYANQEYQEHILRESTPLIRGQNSVLGRMELVPWSTLYESMLRARVIKSQVDVSQVYTNQFLPF